MSASEKLRALEAWEDEGWDSRPVDVRTERIGDMLVNALPQIRALVEAAESVTSADPGAWHGSRLLLALAALDKALPSSSPFPKPKMEELQ